MKFSYSLIKQLVPQVKSKKELMEKLNLHSFEVEDIGGDIFDASIPPNRYSDAASHWGIGAEIAAILGINFRMFPSIRKLATAKDVGGKAPFKVRVGDKNLCPRYRAELFTNVSVRPSPRWMQKILLDCGLRPINNIVDIMNYVMLESGQPLHAFDYDKLDKKKPPVIVVRRAKKNEKITTLDNKEYQLNPDILVIANSAHPIALAGIKGGKHVEISKSTKRIIVEAANFKAANIYRAAKKLWLDTDASLRFSRGVSPNLVAIGLNRAAELLGIAMARRAGVIDINFAGPRKTTIKFNLDKFNKFIGIKFDIATVRRYLKLLGFEVKATVPNNYPSRGLLVLVPPFRSDIETHEDLTEEISRLYGYNKLKSIPPRIHLVPSGFEDQIVLRDKVRKALISLGLSEVYNYSFVSKKDFSDGGFESRVIEPENPISSQFQYLRPDLCIHLSKNVSANFRFMNSIKIFEVGKVFFKDKNIFSEKTLLGVALGQKEKENFFELKGILESLFRSVGLVDFRFVEEKPRLLFYSCFNEDKVLTIKSDNESIGYLGRIKNGTKGESVAIAAIDFEKLLKLVSEEHEYQPLSKHPSVMRDISFVVREGARIGDIIQAIQDVDFKTIEDVDIIDEYKNSLTLRIIFQADKRTLTDKEVNNKMQKISALLTNKFRAEIR